LVKGATWPNAVAFMVASTNLVFEIFIVIVSVLGWSFFGGEIIGGVLFIVISAWLIARFYPARIAQDAKDHLVRQNKQHGDGDMHMAGHEQSGLQQKDVKEPETPKGFGNKLKLASGHFYMDVMMVGKDILVGVVAASVIMAVVPAGFWNALFLTNNHVLPHFLIVLWDIVIGVLVAIFSFVCSVGNIVMGAALWHGGISFGGVIAYILADLVTIPMLAVYKDYFGKKSMFALLALLSLSIVIAALSVDLGFHLLGLIPQTHGKQPMEMAHTFEWNYKTLLNLFFIPVSVIYFFYGKKQSGMKM
ncbi:MAG: metal ion permease, partial [Sphingobacteriaceae bacterium]